MMQDETVYKPIKELAVAFARIFSDDESIRSKIELAYIEGAKSMVALAGKVLAKMDNAEGADACWIFASELHQGANGELR